MHTALLFSQNFKLKSSHADETVAILTHKRWTNIIPHKIVSVDFKSCRLELNGLVPCMQRRVVSCWLAEEASGLFRWLPPYAACLTHKSSRPDTSQELFWELPPTSCCASQPLRFACVKPNSYSINPVTASRKHSYRHLKNNCSYFPLFMTFDW